MDLEIEILESSQSAWDKLTPRYDPLPNSSLPYLRRSCPQHSRQQDIHMYTMMKIVPFTSLLLFICCFLAWPATNEADQFHNLQRLIESEKSSSEQTDVDAWVGLDANRSTYSPVYLSPQDGLMEADKVDMLPGQPQGENSKFNQYAGYVTVDPNHGRALFYYFAESPQDSSTKPLVLWLNGGPGCSSLTGAMLENGPFRIYPDGKTLYENDYSWNNVANVIYLESPAGVGFSYSNTTSDYDLSGDKRTADDAYTFLVNWLERYPQYKARDFYITGESYGGHYVPQLAYTILLNNKYTNQTVINLKGMAVGNAWIDHDTNYMGRYDFLWTHALSSDESQAQIQAHCNFSNITDQCFDALDNALEEIGEIDMYNIYAPVCQDTTNNRTAPKGSITSFDPCSSDYLEAYLNVHEVQKAMHANVTALPDEWGMCSGDADAVCPVTATRYFVNKLGLPIDTNWRAWYTNNEVGGYVVRYKGLTLVTVRGAGHLVPSYQPQRALTMISSFLQGVLPPPSS
ncbi:hypothetical protein ACLOJK_013632 [Asimina triloba]